MSDDQQQQSPAFNFEACQERHLGVAREIVSMHEVLNEYSRRLGKVENRFIALLTGIALNLIGVIGIFIVLLLRHVQ